jgi:hypothetical protein
MRRVKKRELELPHTVTTCLRTQTARQHTDTQSVTTHKYHIPQGITRAFKGKQRPNRSAPALHDTRDLTCKLDMHESDQHTPNHRVPYARTRAKTPAQHDHSSG